MTIGMDNGKVQITGWPAAILVALLVLGGGGYLVAIPGRLHQRERKAIIEHIRDERSAGLAESVDKLKEDVNNSEQVAKTLALANDSLQEIKIVSEFVPPRRLSLGKRVKIEYTVAGKKPKDGGFRYFRIRRIEARSGSKSYRVRELTKQRYESWW
ncbi:MAG: hypothetical protein HN904_06125 [Victivallales bacterium]|nr:hypothetical protein [Victivallales bacterium]